MVPVGLSDGGQDGRRSILSPGPSDGGIVAGVKGEQLIISLFAEGDGLAAGP